MILCTDGLANKGLGALDSLQTESESNAFYQELAELAFDNGYGNFEKGSDYFGIIFDEFSF